MKKIIKMKPKNYFVESNLYIDLIKGISIVYRSIFRVSSIFIFLSFILLLPTSCKKFIEVAPPFTSLNAGNVFTSDATAAAVLTNLYADMSAQNNETSSPLNAENIVSISLFSSLGADELILFNLNSLNHLEYYRNDLTKLSGLTYWNSTYNQIFATNNAIESLNASMVLTPAVKQQLLGEAKYIRAFCYFYLVNMYGDIPLVLNLDWKVTALLPRIPKAQVWQQIISDLKEAQSLLSSNYLKGDALSAYPIASAERVRPTKWAATAMLARVYLYIGDWSKAEAEATAVITNSSMYSLSSLANAFKMNNGEAIWQLQPVGNNANSNTGEGKLFILSTGGPNTSINPVYLSMNVVNAFEAGDLRKANWLHSVKVGTTTYYYAYKYKIGNVIAPTSEYPTILRLAEQYLIRAEARAQQNNISGAQADLNTIRTRAGLPNISASDKTSLLTSILHERQVELFTEWGHRWFDLKRTGNIDAVMNIVAPTKGGSWSSFKALYPIPQTEIDKNQNLIQNPGY